LYEVGKFGYFAIIVFSLYVFARNFRRTTWLKAVFFWTLILFFLPIYLSNDINVTFLSYAIAHGLQYIIFMGVVSLGAEQGERARAVRYRNALKLMLLMILLGLLFYHADPLRRYEFVKNSRLLLMGFDFLFGAVLGATMAHFVIDAGAWRLSKLPQREYMTKRFGFIFAARDTKEPLVRQ
jgi:heme A synthase